jgi:hypothetical protein
MAITKMYHTCFEKIRQVRPKERVTRVRNMAWLLAGLSVGQSVHLSHIARKLPGRSQKLSKVKMLSRLLDNQHIHVRSWYEPVARNLLLTAARHGQVIRLIVDGTKVGNGHQLLMVALAYQRRTLPIAWTWVKGKRGHSSAQKQCALLAYVHGLLPDGTRVELAGDSEFGAIDLLRRLDQWGWGYALRQKGNHLIRLDGHSAWKRCDSLVSQPGETCWFESVLLTQKFAYPTNFLAYWKKGETEPWLLATNLDSPQATQKLYKTRMWIEEMFADFKGHGFDLESSRLEHFLRLSRLTLAVSLLYVWIVAFGSQTIKNGKRRLVDRSDRRDLSVFRIGLDMLERCLANHEPFSFRSSPYFYKVYGG